MAQKWPKIDKMNLKLPNMAQKLAPTKKIAEIYLQYLQLFPSLYDQKNYIFSIVIEYAHWPALCKTNKKIEKFKYAFLPTVHWTVSSLTENLDWNAAATNRLFIWRSIQILHFPLLSTTFLYFLQKVIRAKWDNSGDCAERQWFSNIKETNKWHDTFSSILLKSDYQPSNGIISLLALKSDYWGIAWEVGGGLVEEASGLPLRGTICWEEKRNSLLRRKRGAICSHWGEQSVEKERATVD